MEKDVPVTGAPEFLAGSARGTLPAHMDGPGGRRAVALVVHDDGVVLTVSDVRRTYLWSEVPMCGTPTTWTVKRPTV
ncbi:MULTISPECIES: hypothetical protein [unclassified Streptomyces]|uniref:hypothetical protein n=1 Tax=unclassified Streptomyces TaxID=2593676 RepID=UPI00164FAAF4|nr:MULTISPECIES: hypothetical protein [unclassified Streptomyces]WSR11151.1 hypothetical protein OG265_36325 [Streptomyces sp. NBC_01208]WSR46104.1 hypothetical protein OG279_00050 [Streptomyces sp. NBC_01201]